MIEIKKEKYYTSQEVADKFDVNVTTVARWRTSGKLTAYRISERKYLYSETNLERMIKGE